MEIYDNGFFTPMDPIRAAAIMNKKRGLACKFARQYVNSIVTSRSHDVTSLFRHLPYDVLFKKTRRGFNISQRE